MLVSRMLLACFITSCLSIVTGCSEEFATTEESVTTPVKFLNPDVDVTITPEDVEVRELKSIISEYPESTRFLIKAGTYRMQTISPKKGMVFYGDVDTNGNRHTIFNGSRLLTDFERADGLYFVTGQEQEGAAHGRTESGWEGSVHPEDLFFDDVALKQVLSKSEVTTDTWYFDYANDIIWFANDPSGHKVETSVTRFAFHETHNMSTAPQVTIKGFIVEKYANKAQKGAIGGEGDNEQWHVEYNEIRLTHGSGILVGANSKVLYNYSHHNGHIGMKSRGDGNLFQGNETSYNNTQHFQTGWESGGAKFAAVNGLTLKDNYSHHNYGRGLWIDRGSHNVIIDNNLITYNNDEGILYEISDTGTITNNRLAHNGQVTAWLHGSNIVMSSSANVEVSGNTVIVNAGYGNGITALWTDRHLNAGDLGHTPPLRVENIDVHHNDITYLGILNAQSEREPVSGAAAAAGVDEFDASGTIDGILPDASLVVSDVEITDPRLNNRFNNNTYHVSDLIKNWFRWGRSASRITWDDFRTAGNEIGGVIDDNVTDSSAFWTWTPAINSGSFMTEVVW